MTTEATILAKRLNAQNRRPAEAESTGPKNPQGKPVKAETAELQPRPRRNPHPSGANYQSSIVNIKNPSKPSFSRRRHDDALTPNPTPRTQKSRSQVPARREHAAKAPSILPRLPRNHALIAQNKPNPQNPKTNLTPCPTKNYKQKTPQGDQKKQTQSNPISPRPQDACPEGDIRNTNRAPIESAKMAQRIDPPRTAKSTQGHLTVASERVYMVNSKSRSQLARLLHIIVTKPQKDSKLRKARNSSRLSAFVAKEWK